MNNRGHEYTQDHSTDYLYKELRMLHGMIADAKESIELIKSELNRRLADGDKKPIQYTANSGSCMMPEGR
jgi:hypothetical protein